MAQIGTGVDAGGTGTSAPASRIPASRVVTVAGRKVVEQRREFPPPLHSAFMTAVRLLAAGRASLFLRDPVEPVLSVAASVGIDPQLANTLRVAVGQGIAGLVAERGISLVGRVGNDSFLSAPIFVDSGIEGVLNVTHRQGGKLYTLEDISLAASATQHIGELIQYGRQTARDPVSDLPNRRAFEDILERSLALGERTGDEFAIVFLDLNDLKSINDTYGHNRGDAVIKAVGKSLQHVLRPYDFAGRFGGDEFVLLLPGSIESDRAITDRVALALETVSRDTGLKISSSVGIARWPVDGFTGQDLIATADARMYEQKRAHKRGR